MSEDNSSGSAADALSRACYADSDTMTVMVTEQLAGFASNSLIALDHPPDHLAQVAMARASAALRRLTGEAKP